MGLAFQAHAEIVVRDAPIHAVPEDDDDSPDAAPSPETAAPPKPEPAVVKALVQPKAPPPAPTLTPDENAFFTALGSRVTDAASAYESYVRRVTAIDPAFSGAAAVQHAVKAGAAYHPGQLREGMIAYAALIALRNPDFVDGVRTIQNPSFADDLAVHPEAVMQVRGASGAAADAAGVLQAQGAAMMAAGKAITKAAYDIQTQAWSKSPVQDPQGVLAGAKESSGEMRAATTPSKEKLLASLTAMPQGTPSGMAPSPDVLRGVALAAMAILGRTTDGSEARYEALLSDSSSEECLKMAKLNLNQCLAVAGPHYEDVYCAGRHAVADTGKCVADAAGGAPADAAPAPKLQEAAAIGPEQAAVYGKTPSAPPADTDDEDVAQPVAAAPALAAAPAPTAMPAPAVAPRQYAEAPVAALATAPAPAPAAPQAPPQAALQYAQPQPAPAPTYAPPPQQPTYSYPQNAYAQNSYPPPAPQAPPAQYARTYAQPAYQQQYQPQPYQQPYPQPQYAPQQAYQPQQPYPAQPPYQPPPAYAGQQQPYYPPQNQGYPAYQGNYYGR